MMTSGDYERISARFRTPAGERFLNTVNFMITRLCYVSYPLALIGLLCTQDARLLRCILTPAIPFIILSVYRNVRNAPRPYELLDIHPLIHKDKPGKSFPSRHVFSVFVIAATFYYLCPWLGIVFLALGVILALCRVIGGVHWPSDVIVGAAAGLLSGVVGYCLLELF